MNRTSQAEPRRSLSCPRTARGLWVAEAVEEDCVCGRLSLSSTTLAFTSMVGGSSLARAARAVLPDVLRASPAEHALKKRGGFDQLAGASQAGGFANCVVIEHLITSFCRRERP